MVITAIMLLLIFLLIQSLRGKERYNQVIGQALFPLLSVFTISLGIIYNLPLNTTCGAFAPLRTFAVSGSLGLLILGGLGFLFFRPRRRSILAQMALLALLLLIITFLLLYFNGCM